MPNSAIGLRDRLKECRRRAGTTEALAAAAGVHKSTLEGWLAGRGKWRAAGDLVRIARAAGVRVEWLLTGEPPIHEQAEIERFREATGGARLDDDALVDAFEVIEEELAKKGHADLPAVTRALLTAEAYRLILAQTEDEDLRAKLGRSIRLAVSNDRQRRGQAPGA